MIQFHYTSILCLFSFIYFLLANLTPLSAKTVVDQMDRKVIMTDNPVRIVSMAPSITEIVYALGQGNRLVGATLFSDFPESAKKLPKVGSYVHLDLERIVALTPDLCIAVKDGNPKNVVDRLESIGIPVYAVNPQNLKSAMATMIELGELLNASQKANMLVLEMHRRVERIKNMAQKAPQRPRVFFQIGISPIVSVGTDTFLHELIQLAGGENVAAGRVAYPRYSKEDVVGFAPEVFIISSMARGYVFQQVKTQWQRWPNIPAVKNSRILLLDSDILDRPTPRLVDGLELLFQLIHPELVPIESHKGKNQNGETH